MRRGKAIAVASAAAALALTAAGCGVQPTGVNIAQTEPFGESSASSPQTVSPSQYPYTVSVFLFSSVNRGPGTMINRPVAKQPDPMDLPNELAQLSNDEELAQYTTYVPPGLTFKATDQAHMYIVNSPTKLGALALQQLYCTFDQWWIGHPDTHNPSTRLIVQSPGGDTDTYWQDCTEGVVPANAGGGTPTKPSEPAVSKSFAGN